MSSCEDNIPRHGFSPQEGHPPMEIVMDKHTLTSDTYLRITIRSRKAFKGFLIEAENDEAKFLGTWYIPYLADTSYLSESQYLHCNNHLQSAVTHSGQTSSMWVVSFQWRPGHNYTGWTQFRATVVESYQVYWVNVISNKVFVKNNTSDDVVSNVISDKRTSYYDYKVNQGEEGQVESNIGNYTDFLNLLQDNTRLDVDWDDKKQIPNMISDSVLLDMKHHTKVLFIKIII